MAYIKVDINKLGQLESQLSRIPSVISSTASTVRSVRSGLDWDVACESNIDSTLRGIASDLEACKSRLQNTVRFLDSAVQEYNKVEYGGKNPYHTGGRSGGGGSSRSFIALANSYVSQFWDENSHSRRFSSVADICAALATSPFRALNVYAKRKSYLDIIGNILKDGFDNTVNFLADQYNIAKDKIQDLGECIKADIIEASNAVVENFKTGATMIKGTISNWVSAIKEDYEAKGTSYRIIKGLGAVVDIAVGTGTLVCAIAGTGVTAGLGAPATVLIGAYGGNQAISGFADLFNCITGNVDDVGEVNLLKSFSTGVCGQAGKWLGNREMGESVGEAIYTIGGITSTVVSLTNLSGQIKQAHSSGKTLSQSVETTKKMVADASKEISGVFSKVGKANGISDAGYLLKNCKISNLKYEITMLSKQLPSVCKIVSDANLVTKGVEESKKIIDAGIEVVNTLAGWEMIQEPTYFKSVEQFNKSVDKITDPLDPIDKIKDSGEKISDVFSIQLLDLFEPMPVWDI